MVVTTRGERRGEQKGVEREQGMEMEMARGVSVGARERRERGELQGGRISANLALNRR
jgi:hypothetical protein